MIIKRTRGEKIFDYFNVVILCLLLVVIIAPMLHVLNLSFSSGTEADKGGFFLYPRGLSAFAYGVLFKADNVLLSYWNTIKYTVVRTFFTVFLSSMIAYSLSISDFMFKKFTIIFLTIPMFISGGMIPSFLLMRQLSLINTIWAIVLPGCVSCYNVILFRTFFKANAMELRESAIIEGAGEFYTYLKIVVPLSTAIFATLALFTAVWTWNSWYESLIYLQDSYKFPYQMILKHLLEWAETTMYATESDSVVQYYQKNKFNAINLRMAAVIVGMAPIICIYPFAQKYFVKGVFVGSLKE